MLDTKINIFTGHMKCTLLSFQQHEVLTSAKAQYSLKFFPFGISLTATYFLGREKFQHGIT